MSTVVAYVVSPGWELNLYMSLHSLELSNTSYDYIKVFSVGGELKFLENLNLPIQFESVRDKNDKYFPENKTYITSINEERIIYLDADTIVLKPIQKVYGGVNVDFIGRYTHYYESEGFEEERWNKILERNNTKYSPYFNSGFIIFQNYSQKELKSEWEILSRRNLKNMKERELMGKRVSEQIALSACISKNGLSVKKMKKKEHVYGWETTPKDLDTNEEEVVYHTGSRGGRYVKYATSVLRKSGINYARPVISSANNPLFLKMLAYDVMYAAKHSVVGLP